VEPSIPSQPAAPPAATEPLPPEPVLPEPAAPEPEAAAPADPDAGPPTRRRGRVVRLVAAAALLGLSAGTAYGYHVQADERPTPLPRLAQQGLAYPEKPMPADEAPEPLGTRDDHRVRTDGDLRKLLLDRPKGALGMGKPDWMSIPDFASHFEEPAYIFDELSNMGLRRVARTRWLQGDVSAEILLAQFQDADSVGGDDYLSGQAMYMPDKDHASAPGKRIPGTSDGSLFIYRDAVRKPGYLPSYQARALARRGDIVVDVWFSSPEPIRGAAVMAAVKRQLERL
jgi:hypothetical protein